jgi:hypothetical protein
MNWSILITTTKEVHVWMQEHGFIKDPTQVEKHLSEHSLRIGQSRMMKSDGRLSENLNKKRVVAVLEHTPLPKSLVFV